MKNCKLNDLIELKKGKKPNSFCLPTSQNTMPYVDIKAFEKGFVEKFTDDEKCVKCENGDLLIVCDGSRSGLVGRAIPGYVGSTLAKIEIDERLECDYLFYFLQSRYRTLNKSVKGTGTPHLNPTLLKSFEISVPPIQEQKRIVARIEELFSNLDSAVETLQKTKQQLEVYRQAVYGEAYSTLNDLQNITDFFEISGGLTKNSNRSSLPIVMPYLRVANVYYNYLDLTEIKQIGVKNSEIKEKLLKTNDLLFVEGNGSKSQIGRVAIWNGNISPCLHQNHIIKGRPNGKMLSKYALFYLISRFGREQILKVASSTSGLYTLSTGKICNLKIPYCSIENQTTIINSIEEKVSICESIEQLVELTLQQAEAMRQSILKQAFEGGIN